MPADSDGIVLQNDPIPLDPNGFSIVGGGRSTGVGVESSSGLLRGHRVMDGFILSMPGHGIDLADEACVENVSIFNGGYGIDRVSSAGHSGNVMVFDDHPSGAGGQIHGGSHSGRTRATRTACARERSGERLRCPTGRPRADDGIEFA